MLERGFNKVDVFCRLLVLLIGLLLSVTLAKSQIKLLESGTGSENSPDRQKSYGYGGETKLNRITDLEKSLDDVKSRLAEMDDLKRRVEELEKLIGQRPTEVSPKTLETRVPTDTPSRIFIRKE